MVFIIIVQNRKTGKEKVSSEAFSTLEKAKNSIRHKGSDYVGEEFKTDNELLGWFGWTYFGKTNNYIITEVIKMTYREAQKKLHERMCEKARQLMVTDIERLVYQTVDELPCRNWDDEVTERDIAWLCSRHSGNRYIMIFGRK